MSTKSAVQAAGLRLSQRKAVLMGEGFCGEDAGDGPRAAALMVAACEDQSRD
jgi:hypothetical protein